MLLILILGISEDQSVVKTFYLLTDWILGGSWVVKHRNSKFMCTVVISCQMTAFDSTPLHPPDLTSPLFSLWCFPRLDGAGSDKIDLLSAAGCSQSVIRPRYIVYMYSIFQDKPFYQSVHDWLILNL